jgi:hypothetical protein
MKKLSNQGAKKLSREEMKSISGGIILHIWHCQDVPGGPYISVACSSGNPAGRPNCPEYSCFDTGVSCSTATGCS